MRRSREGLKPVTRCMQVHLQTVAGLNGVLDGENPDLHVVVVGTRVISRHRVRVIDGDRRQSRGTGIGELRQPAGR